MREEYDIHQLSVEGGGITTMNRAGELTDPKRPLLRKRNQVEPCQRQFVFLKKSCGTGRKSFEDFPSIWRDYGFKTTDLNFALCYPTSQSVEPYIDRARSSYDGGLNATGRLD